jgi:hypothetical protein
MKLNLKIGAAVIAAAGLIGGVANASTIGATTAATAGTGTTTAYPVTYSLEGQTLSGLVADTVLPAFEVTLGADYALGDTIAVSIAGATIDPSPTQTALNIDPAGAHTVGNLGIHCWFPGPPSLVEDSIIVSVVTVTPTVVNLRVTVKNVTSAVGDICRIQGINVLDKSIATLTSVTVNWQATTGIGTPTLFDGSQTPNPLLASTVSQFASNWTGGAPIVAGTPCAGPLNTSTSLAGIIDVGSGRIYFATPGTLPPVAVPANADSTEAVACDLTTGSGLVFTAPTATLDTVVFTLFGTFGELGTAGACTLTSAAAALTVVNVSSGAAPAAVEAIAAGCSSISETLTIGVVGESQKTTFTFNGTNGTVMTPQTFSGTTVFSYHLTGTPATKGSRSDTAANPGAWTLNGFSAFVAYMPFGTGISPIVYLTNKSTQAGTVTIVGYTDTGVAFQVLNAGSIAKGAILSLGAALQAAVPAGFTGKVSFNVIATIPQSLGELYTAYNAAGNRNVIVNTSNGRVDKAGNSTTGNSL